MIDDLVLVSAHLVGHCRCLGRVTMNSSGTIVRNLAFLAAYGTVRHLNGLSPNRWPAARPHCNATLINAQLFSVILDARIPKTRFDVTATELMRRSILHNFDFGLTVVTARILQLLMVAYTLTRTQLR